MSGIKRKKIGCRGKGRGRREARERGRGEERERETRLAAEYEEREERALRNGIRNTVRKCGVCGKALASLKAQDWTEEKFCISLIRDSG